MAAVEPKDSEKSSSSSSSAAALFSSYLGISFAVFLGFLPRSSVGYVSSLQSRNRILSLKLFHVEDQLRGLRSRRKEDAKANARVVEIFAGHRSSWQAEERRLLGEIAGLRSRVEELEGSVERLEREVEEREEMIEFMGRGERECCVAPPEEEESDRGMEAYFLEGEELAAAYAAAAAEKDGFGREFVEMPTAAGADSRRWIERSTGWQDMQYDSHESMHHVKNFAARRESPWKVDGDSTGVSSKLKLLEEELLNLENVGKGDMSKVPSLMRKQAKRYQSLTGKVDDLCRRMQVNDPCESNLSPEFRTQQQTEFLVEASRLQHRAAEMRQKLSSLQAEAAKGVAGSGLAGHTVLNVKRSVDTIGKNFKEIQRNLEIWLARIIGDVEGTLARDGESRVRDYYISRYPFVR
ncbi:uncharacterized protein M6B38_281135 [Iris pallida]|uniref:Uncharacterized protein n=1 Tax=Iris pallida TaxID=29817 RepID=A0AAX6HZM1_IRIPA|nr:uncharacterized protein M6B38_281135 [Iris pallida]